MNIIERAKWLLTHTPKQSETNAVISEWWENQDGEQDGPLKVVYKHHEPGMQICNFKCGKLDGQVKVWFRNGELHQVTNLKDDKLDGESLEWDKDGKLVLHILYKDGIGIEDLLKK